MAVQMFPIASNAVTIDDVQDSSESLSVEQSDSVADLQIVDEDGNKLESMSLAQEDFCTIHLANPASDAELQWQIRDFAQTNNWINIYEQTENSLYVSYALINNVSQLYGSAYIRCKVTVDDDVDYSSVLSIVKIDSQDVSDDSTDPLASQKAKVSRLMSKSVEEVGDDNSADTEIVTITINYLDATDGTPIFSPYVAHIEAGSDFTQKVISPTFLGFTPYYCKDDPYNEDPELATDDASVLNPNFIGLTHDDHCNVYYKASDVDYQIAYWFQNINDDNYTENTSLRYHGKEKTGTIISDETIEEHAGDLTGFTALYHYPEAVAADGSTVFYCYYDRNYTMLKFDTDGGYGVDPIYARYDTPFVVNNPVRPGYIFVGWDLLTEDTDDDFIPDTGDGFPDTLPSTVPAENQYYKALWQTSTTNITIVYWKENADDGEYSYWGSDSSHQAQSSSYINGSTYSELPSSLKTGDYEQFEYNHADKNVYVQSDGSTYVNVYYTRTPHTITFRNLNSSWVSGVTTHTHTDDCYELTCDKEEHTHGDDCKITCGLEEHVHSSECCSIEEHTHSLQCYGLTAGVTLSAATSSNYGYTSLESNPVDGRFACYFRTGRSYGRTYYYYYYYVAFGGVWYYLSYQSSSSRITSSYSSNGLTWNTSRPTTSGNVAYQTLTRSCGYNYEHTHGDGNCNIANCPNGGVSHVHTASCYSCGLEEHTHSQDEGCYTLTCTQPETTLTYVSSGTYRGTYTYTVKTKYAADISNVWETAPIKNALDQAYVFQSSVTSNYYSFLQLMESQDITMTATSWSGNTYSWDYYLEVPEGMDTTGYTTNTVDGITYYVYHTSTIKGSGISLTYKEDYFDIVGYTQTVSESDFDKSFDSTYHKELYYNLASYNLTFTNADGNVLGEYTLDYKANLDKYVEEMGTPEYPSTLEPNAYEFAGWYTTSDLIPGTEYEAGTTMPAGNYALYAKWTPVTHTVRFFLTNTYMQQYEADSTQTEGLLETRVVEHGNYAGSIDNPTYEMSGQQMTFGGWFFIDTDGTKKAFTPLDYPVRKDMNVFADWSSHTPQPYRIDYVLKNNHDEYVADSSLGYAYGGSTRTFNAKAGDPFNQLYEEYNNGYFPTISSHSITMDFEDTGTTPETASVNTFQFEYVHAENVEYTVRYVDKNTGAVLHTEKKVTTNSSVVTERFTAIAGYVPDAFYKRLVLAVEDDGTGTDTYVGSASNIITFYYSENEASAYYAVHFMLQKEGVTSTSNYAIDGSGDYTDKTTTYIDGIGDIGSTQSITPMEFPGFTVVSDHGTVIRQEGDSTSTRIASLNDNGQFEITITEDGTELYIFYTRNNYEYNVYYYEYGTTNELAETTTGTAPYGSTQEFTAKSIDSYTCVSSETQRITIRDNNLNTVIFYYSPIQYPVQYKILDENNNVINSDRADCGRISRTIQVIEGTDDFDSTTATPNDGYKFVGWFVDENCDTTAAASGKASVDGTTMTPIKANITPVDANANIFYAKFVKIPVLELDINHTLSADSTDTSAEVLASARVLSSTGEELASYDNSSNTLTIEDDYLKHGMGYQLEITLKTNPSDGGVFADFLYDGSSLSDSDFGATYTKNTVDSQTATFTVDVESLLEHDEKYDIYTLISNSLDFVSLVNKYEYSLRYQFTTRQFGDKIYEQSGTLTTDDLSKYFASDLASGSLTGLNTQFVLAKAPSESNFMQVINWNESEIQLDGFKATLTAEQHAKDVTAYIYTSVDASGAPVPSSLVKVTTTYKEWFTVDDEFVKVDKSNQSGVYSYWAIYDMDDYNDSDGDVQPLAKCYSEYFNYGALGDYVVIPVFGEKPNTDYITQESGEITTYATFYGVTRNYWNNTVSGTKDNIGKYDEANTAYDRLYADFDIQFLYKGEIIKEHTGSDQLEVGITIEAYDADGNLVSSKDSKIKTSQLSNKNRIEYYISFANNPTNLSYTFHAKPYVSVNGTKYYSSAPEIEFNLSSGIF